MKILKQFFKHSETFVGIATAISFLLIFFCVWMTAYDGVYDRSNKLKIGIVNEDKQMGVMIENQLIKNIPFKIIAYKSLDSANKDMNQRELDMVIHIPSLFSSQLQEKEKVEINYFINQANTPLAKQIMEGAAKNITQSINLHVYSNKQQLILSNLPKQLDETVPSKELAQNVSKSIAQVLQSLNIQSVQTSVTKTNNVDGFEVTMVPLMIVLASFVGSMIMSLNLNIVSSKLKDQYNKWAIFFTRQTINMGASILLTFITLLFLFIFNIEIKPTLFETGAFQILVYFSFLSLTQMFVVLFGPGGMLFNILTLSLQLVTSGVIVPKTMLSNFYQSVGSYLPATYAADGYYTVIYGGESLLTYMVTLFLISGVSLFITVIKILFQKDHLLTANKLTLGENNVLN
ncbi:YhgE/Pip domain-containing protein [Bacillus sp. JJ722]|uniref:YhgE/Pip domain-containing protein n=1 Tax=Bacillus sp. JJ722 TaxID=3122973 RepID=UPI002FFF75E3